MLKTILVPLVLPVLFILNHVSDNPLNRRKQISHGSAKSVASVKQSINGPADTEITVKPHALQGQTGTLEKMAVTDGSATLEVDLNRLNGYGSKSQFSSLRFGVAPDSFFTILVFNRVLRGPLSGSLALIPQSSANLPPILSASFNQLVIDKTEPGEPYELVVRDGRTGFKFFNIEGNVYDYNAKTRSFKLEDGRLLISEEFAVNLDRNADAGLQVGRISVTATMRAIEITELADGQVTSAIMPPLGTLLPGPDVIVGELSGLAQFGSSSGTQVGLAVGTDSCNAGAEPLHWFALPSNDHPVIPQNLYRMSGGPGNDERFEQVGQSNVKHAFTALQNNICGFGCQSSGTGTLLGAGCSDPYSASLNAGPNLGSRAWINPFTGAYPRGDSPTPPNTHTGHTHLGPSHRILVEMSDLNTTLNPGATYYAEAQYVTPHEYAWCQAHPGECNQYNNVSYRRYNVTGTTSFSFSAVGSTNRSKSAIVAWTGASFATIEPDPGNDGVAVIAYKVTNTSPGIWHYEYAIYNENLDRAIQSFSLPSVTGLVVNNVGFHAPPQHPGWTADGTVGNTGYSSTPWGFTQASDSLTWNTQTFAQNQNANAIRWGTLYNFRFDSDRPPQTTNATVGFFKTGAPITVQIQGPSGAGPTPTPTPTPGPGYTVTASPSTVSPGQAITVSWTAPAGQSATDWIGLYRVGDSEGAYMSYQYTGGASSGSVQFTAPSQAGQYEFRYFTNDSFTRVATSNTVTVGGSFSAVSVASPISNPTAMAFAPDGRLFVCQQTGELRVIDGGVLQATPFTTLTVNSSGERGLLGVAFDPNFVTNRFVYVYYTATTPAIHNRVSRFTANGNVAVVGSEVPILDLNNLSGATNHNGGAIHFGPDGLLYIAVGENANSANSQSIGNLLGKILRINSNGTIPSDNPTTFPGIAGSPSGNNRAIWSVGLRNPYTFDFQPGTGRMFINDVGQTTWEEINDGIAGSNYGWAICEGACSPPNANYRDPLFQYGHGIGPSTGCAITGGAFYNPSVVAYPSEYLGKYFYAEFCSGWIRRFDPATSTSQAFATGLSSPVDLKVGPDGNLYYLVRGGGGAVFKIVFS